MQSLSAPLTGPIVRPPAVALRLASDARLTRLAANGSEAAMAMIFERHNQALHRYCHSIVGNSHDAADALQNTMVKALRALSGEQRQIELRPWLYRIAHNESISLLRARRPDSDLDSAMHVSDVAADGVLESRERLRSLTDDLGELSERQRGALLMRELSGLEFTEVADALGTSANAAKQHVYEARCALHAMQEGRAMDCETVRRTLSDGDRRTLRGLRMRGHLRACTGCRDFEAAMHQRPAQLTAMIPVLPVAAAATMLQSILGGGSSSGWGGGGLATAIAGGAKTTAGVSMAGKAAAVMAVSATLAGGAVYTVPKLDSASPERATPRAQPADPASTPRAQPAAATLLQRSSNPATGARADRATSSADTTSATGKPSSAGKPTVTPEGNKPVVTPEGNKPVVTPEGNKPVVTPEGKPAVTPDGKPAVTSSPPVSTPDAPASPAPDSTGTSGPPASTPSPDVTSIVTPRLP